MTNPTRPVSLLLLLLPAMAAPPLAAQVIDTVRVGGPALRDAALEPGSYVIESFQREDGIDSPISTTRQTIRPDEIAGQRVWVIETVHASDDTTRSSIVVRAADFALRHHRVKATGDSAAVSATPGHLTGWVALPGEPVVLIDRVLEHPVFPVEGQIPWLFPLLPLEDGYAAAIPHFNEWRNEETWQTIRVLGLERIDVAGRARDCWKVDGGELFPGYGVTYWVDRETRRVVRGEARGAEGGPVYWSQLAGDEGRAR